MAEDKLKQAEKFINALNKHDAELAVSSCTENVVYLEMTYPVYKFEGRDAVVAKWHDIFESFPDFKCKVTLTMADEKSVFMEVVFSGTFEKTFRGDKPTGKPVNIYLALVFVFEDGKISIVRDYYDSVSLEKQFGIRKDEK